MHITQRSVRVNHAVFDVHGARAPIQLAARLLPARPVRRMHHRLQIVVHADIGLAIAPAQHPIQVRRPVVLVLAVEVHDVVAEVGDFLGDGELRFTAAQRLLGVAPHGDVANETHESRRLGAPHPADRQFRGELAAVAALGEELPADADDARLTGLYIAAQVVFVLRAVGLGQQDVDLQADHLLLVVAEHALAGVVEQLDAPLVIEEHDRIDRSIQHGLKLSFQPVSALFLRLGDSQEGH